MNAQLVARVRTRNRRAEDLACLAPAITPRLSILYQPASSIRPASRRLRSRGKDQRQRLIANIRRFGCRVAILVTQGGEIIDGHGVYEACVALGFDTVPTIIVDDLQPSELTALRISLNKFGEMSVWDESALKNAFEELFTIDASLLEFTGYDMAEVDAVLRELTAASGFDDPVPVAAAMPVSCMGDRWCWPSGHLLVCGDALAQESYIAALGSERAQQVTTDPPFIGKVGRSVSAQLKSLSRSPGTKSEEARPFFEQFLHALVPHLSDGAVVNCFSRWQGLAQMSAAIADVGLQQMSLCVWDKQCGRPDQPYRQQTEFVTVSKWGDGAFINNIRRRKRTTCWSYPEASSGQGRKRPPKTSPPVKPLDLIVDALLDTSNPGGIVLDPFAGSGTILLAAHRSNRRGRAIELDPKLVDVAINRMDAFCGQKARHVDTGLTFAETAAARRQVVDTVPTLAEQSGSTS